MPLSDVILYHFPLSRSARVRWALHETLGDDFTIENVDLLQGAGYAPDFLAMNPNHAVPVLRFSVDGKSTRTMLESAAIVEWLIDAFPDLGLAPVPGPSSERADYLQALHFAGTWMDSMLWQLRMHKTLLPPDQADERTVTRYEDKWRSEVEPQLAARLAAAPFMCGDNFSGADIVTGHNVRWAQAYGLCAAPCFVAYRERLGERPAYKAAFSDAAQFPG